MNITVTKRATEQALGRSKECYCISVVYQLCTMSEIHRDELDIKTLLLTYKDYN
jgi:hypothetical protein